MQERSSLSATSSLHQLSTETLSLPYLSSLLDLLGDIDDPCPLSFYDLVQFKLKNQGFKGTITELLLDPQLNNWSPAIKHQLAQLYPEDSDILISLVDNYHQWLHSQTKNKHISAGTVRLSLGSNILFPTTDKTFLKESSVNIDMQWPSLLSKEDIIQAFFEQQLDIDKWIQLVSGLIPSLMVRLESLTLPPIESFTGNYSILLENITLNCLKIDSKHFELNILPDNLNQNIPSQRLPSPTARIIKIKLGNVQAEAHNAQITFEKKVGFPKFSDEGLLDLIIPEDSLSITILLAVEVEPAKLLAQLKNLKANLDDSSTKINSGIVEDIFSFNLSDTIKNSKIHTSETKHSNSPPELTLEYPFSDYFDSFTESNTSKFCLISPSTSNYSDSSLTQVNSSSCSETDQNITENTWDGDLTAWPINHKISFDNNNSVLSVSGSQSDDNKTFSDTFKENINPDLRTNNKLFLDWFDNSDSPSSIIPLQFSERRLKAISNQENHFELNSTESTYIDKMINEHFHDIALHSPKLNSSDDNESLIVPSLPDFSPSIYTQLPTVYDLNSIEQEPLLPPLIQPDNNSKSELDPIQSENSKLSESESTDKELPFDLRSLLRVISVKPEIRKVHVRLHDTNRDFLYRITKPFIDHIAKRQLESAIRAVIMNFLREWLIKFLETILEKLESQPTN